MDQARIERLEGSFNLLAPRGQELVDRFYANLFRAHPQLRPMFQDDLTQQKQELLSSLVLAVRNLRTPQDVIGPLQEMGRRHVGYGTKPEHYPVVRDTMVQTMGELAGDAWNAQLESDWINALDMVSSVMLEGAKTAVPVSPAVGN